MGRPREFDRDKALGQAMDLFWTQGYEATGVTELCDTMGLGRQSLYNTFGDKESLFREALSQYRSKWLCPIVDLLNTPGSGLANIERVLDTWEESAKAGNSYGCMMANSIAEFGMRNPKLSRILGSMLGEMEGAFFQALSRARDDGELAEDRDPRTLARLLTTMGQGLSMVGKLDPSGAFVKDSISSVRALL
jgi:TetR/AcrR family transcriptional repressor of nem operon